ncbi:hypothetical protein Hanom_Chr03g00225471 [Helianthus anomalus]
MLDFVTLAIAAQQSKVSITQPQGSSIHQQASLEMTESQGSLVHQQGSLAMTQPQGSFLHSKGYVKMFQPQGSYFNQQGSSARVQGSMDHLSRPLAQTYPGSNVFQV